MENAYTFSNGKLYLRIVLCSPLSVRLTYSASETAEASFTAGFAKEPESPVPASLCREKERYSLKTEALHIDIDPLTLDVTYTDRNGRLLSHEEGCRFEKHGVYLESGGRSETRLTVDGVKSRLTGGSREYLREACSAYLRLRFSNGESVFGLGSHEEGYDTPLGHFVPLYQENMRIAVPVLTSSRGYAYLFDCGSFMTFDGTETGSGELFFDTVDTLDHYFVSGRDYDEVCREMCALTGRTPMPPKWAMGYVQSRERYKTGEELLATAREYRDRKVPIDALVQDWQYWREGLWGDKHFDPARYPDPDSTINALHAMNMHVMISIWPNMSGNSEDLKAFEEAGHLLADGSVYDAFSEEGRALYTKQAFEQLFRYGIDGWWCDSSEPYDAMWQGEERPPMPERIRRSVNEFKKYIDAGRINLYSLFHSRGIYEEQRRRSDKRVINLTRSGFIGQHRYGTVVWSGDVSATWETLERQIRILQNYTACGEAYWNSDIGGFFVRDGREWFRAGAYPDGCLDDAYRELYTRWLQFAGFTPFMRSHGTDTPREIWNFGDEGGRFYEAIKDAIRLRYRFLPYFYSVSAAVTFKGEMPVRALALAFPEDSEASAHTEEYMYGHELLVCPVTKPMASAKDGSGESVEVYLPKLAKGGWYDFYTEMYYPSGQTVSVSSDINRIPVFVRSGAIVPTIEEDIQYVSDRPEAAYLVTAYGGCDGTFFLYEDEGDGYAYEQGSYLMTELHYEDRLHALSRKEDGSEKYRRILNYRIVSPREAAR